MLHSSYVKQKSLLWKQDTNGNARKNFLRSEDSPHHDVEIKKHWILQFSGGLELDLGLIFGLIFHTHLIGAARGRGNIGNVPPSQNGTNCWRKLMLFRKALFLATTFPKIVKSSIFLLLFYQNFPTICVFRPNARKINAWFVKFLEKYAKIMHFCYFLKRSFENFRNSSGVR